MKRVAFVIGQLAVGGGEKQLYLLLRGLDRSRFEPSVVTFHPGAGDYWEQPIEELGVPVHGVRRGRPLALRLVELFGLLRRLRPDVVVSWSLHLNFPTAILGRLAGARLAVASIRNDLFNPMKRDRPLHRFFGIRGADVLVANSTRGREDLALRLGIDPARVVVIFNAVTVPPPGERMHTRDETRAALGLRRAAFLIVNVGRIEPSKNQSMLIRALGRIAAEASDAEVVLIGEGPDTGVVRGLATSLGLGSRVRPLGLVPGVAAKLNAFDVMCHTGVADGMPNVLLEAAACGLPVVSTRVNGSEDVVEEGESGYLVDYGDDAALASKILDLYRAPALRERFGRRGRERARGDSFDERAMVRRFESVFERHG